MLRNETAILSKYHTNKIGIKSIYRVSDPCRFCSVLSGMSCKTRHNWRPNTKGNYEFWKPPSVVLVYNKGRKIYEGSVQNNRTSTGGIWRSRVYEKTIFFFQNFLSLMRWLSCWYKHTALLISTVSLICRVLFFIILLRKWEPISVQLLQWRENLCAWCRWLGWMHPQ